MIHIFLNKKIIFLSTEQYYISEKGFQMNNCYFCKLTVDTIDNHHSRDAYWINCNVCGNYLITSQALQELKSKYKEINNHILNCIYENINLTTQGFTPMWMVSNNRVISNLEPKIMQRTIDDFKLIPITHSNKINGILLCLARKTNNQNPFSAIKITLKDLFSLKINGINEAVVWLTELIKKEYIFSSDFEMATGSMGGEDAEDNILDINYEITPHGWLKIEEELSHTSSKNVFIAMSFKYVNRPSLEKAIKEACSDTGWNAFTIEDEHYLGGITDEIIAKINQSYFVIAEFTENKHGVYYEAGYAAGKGKSVIYIVHEDDVKNLHFDTRHFNHITWKEVDDIKKKLKDRINAVINPS